MKKVDTGQLHKSIPEKPSFIAKLGLRVICEQLNNGECDRDTCIHGSWHRPKTMLAFNRDDREFNCQDPDVCYKIGNPGVHRCVNVIQIWWQEQMDLWTKYKTLRSKARENKIP